MAAEILRGGGLVAFPTETVYGLGADALNAEAVGKVYAAKGRPSDNPMIVHISQKGDMTKLTDGITPDVEKLMAAFWPGPLTMVVPAKDLIPRVTTGGLATVGVRMPEDETARVRRSRRRAPICPANRARRATAMWRRISTGVSTRSSRVMTARQALNLRWWI